MAATTLSSRTACDARGVCPLVSLDQPGAAVTREVCVVELRPVGKFERFADFGDQDLDVAGQPDHAVADPLGPLAGFDDLPGWQNPGVDDLLPGFDGSHDAARWASARSAGVCSSRSAGSSTRLASAILTMRAALARTTGSSTARAATLCLRCCRCHSLGASDFGRHLCCIPPPVVRPRPRLRRSVPPNVVWQPRRAVLPRTGDWDLCYPLGDDRAT